MFVCLWLGGGGVTLCVFRGVSLVLFPQFRSRTLYRIVGRSSVIRVIRWELNGEGESYKKQLHVVYGASTCNTRVRGTDGTGGELHALYHYSIPAIKYRYKCVHNFDYLFTVGCISGSLNCNVGYRFEFPQQLYYTI